MTIRPLSTRTALTAVLALGALLTAGLSAMAKPTDPALRGVGQLRPEIIDPELRAEADTAAAGEGEPVEYLVEVDAAPDLDAIKFEREAVVAALKETAERSQAPVVERLLAQGQEVLNTFWLSNLVLARSTPESMMSLTALPSVEAIRPVLEVQAPEPAPLPIDPDLQPRTPSRPSETDQMADAAGALSADAAGPLEGPIPKDVEPDDVGPNTVADGTRTWGVDRIEAHRVWDELGVDGSGVRVAVLDTGVDITHPDLDGKLVTDDPSDPTFPGGWMEWDAEGNPVESEPHDGHYHGTHVSGTVVGDDNLDILGNDEFNGTAIGVAPGADLMVGAALPDGSGTEPQVLAAMQWVLDPYDIEGNPAGQPADVVNMSFGAANEVRDSYAQAIRNMYFAGVLPVAAAGNDGDGAHGTPANVFESLAIGATDVDDNVAEFSSGGTVQKSDYEDPPAEWPESWVVPDVSAPGVGVISAVPMGYFTGCADAGTCYGTADGTSMAAPHTAGTAALMLSGNPSVGVEEIADLLIDTSFFDDRYGEQRPNTRFGHGRINAFPATSQVVLGSGVTGRVTDADTGDPAAGVWVEVVEAGISTRVDADGGYELRLPPGSYALEVSDRGSVAKTVTDVVVAEDALTTADVVLGGITGQITDAASGDPLADVSVEVAELGLSTTTDAAGHYRFRLVPGSYTLEASKFGYLTRAVPSIAVDDEAVTEVDVPLELAPAGDIAGTVTDAVSGHGVPGVRIEVLDVPVDLSTETDVDGNYEFASVPAGSYELAVTSERSGVAAAPMTVDAEVTANMTVTVDIDLDAYIGSMEKVSVTSDGVAGNDGSGGGSSGVDVSADGRYVAFHSQATNLGDQPLPGGYHVFVHDRETGVTEMVAVSSDGEPTNAGAWKPSISADGRYVAFFSAATNLVEHAPAQGSIYLHDRETGETELVSVGRGGEPANGVSDEPSISADGRYIAFWSVATNLVDDDSQATCPVEWCRQIFVYDRQTGVTELVSRHSNGEVGNSPGVTTWSADISADGRYVAFRSEATNLVDEATNPGADVFVHDRETGETEWVSVLSRQELPAGILPGGINPDISADGQLVTYRSQLGGVPGQFLFDRATGETQLLSVPVEDGQAAFFATGGPIMTADGRFVVFAHAARDEAGALLPEATGLFALDRDSGEIERVVEARYVEAPGFGEVPVVPSHGAISDDCRFVVATSFVEPWMPFDRDAIQDAYEDVYVVDRAFDPDAPQARFAFWDLSVEPESPLPGEPVQVTVGVKNIGDATGDQNALFRVDGVVQEMTTVTLAPGESERLSWTTSREEGVSYEVRVASRAAQFRVQSGTLTVAVSDANDDLPVLNATVTAAKGESTRTSTTGLDGVYQLQNLQIGTWTVTVEADNYVTETFEVTINEDGQRANRDVALRTGITAPDPGAIDATVPAGTTDTAEFTVSNTGTADLDWNAFAWEATVEEEPSILVYTTQFDHPTPNTYVERALRRLGLDDVTVIYGESGNHPDFDDFNPKWDEFRAALDYGGWDLVIFDGGWGEGIVPPDERDAVFDALNAYVQDGGRLIAYDGYMGDSASHPLWATLGVEFVRHTARFGTQSRPGAPIPDAAYWWEPDHPLLADPLSVPEFTDMVNGPTQVGNWLIYQNNTGARVEPLEGFQSLAGSTEEPAPEQARLVLGNDGRTLFRGFVDATNPVDLDRNGIRDSVELWVNSITHMLDLTPHRWLEVDDSGTLAPDGSAEVTGSIDASNLEPGTYTGTVGLVTDAAREPNVTIPLTLEVTDACPDGFSAEENIVFRDEDSGVPNYDRGDGCTFLDLVWAEAPFANHGEFVRVVRDLSEQWRDDGLLTRREAQRILIAAAGSDIGRRVGARSSGPNTVI